MIHKKSGLNNSDKIFVTVALWISAVVLFVTELTLPMLPDQVAIFYYPVEGITPELSSKFNNLLLVVMWAIPAVIIVITAVLKKRNRLQNNFMSIILFSIILSLSFSAVIIYGINRQFAASMAVRNVNIHAIVCVITLFVLSMIFAILPKVYHSEKFNDRKTNVVIARRLKVNTDKYWSIGACGYIVMAAVCAIIPDYYCYIALVGAVVAHILFIFLNKGDKIAA